MKNMAQFSLTIKRKMQQNLFHSSQQSYPLPQPISPLSKKEKNLNNPKLSCPRDSESSIELSTTQKFLPLSRSKKSKQKPLLKHRLNPNDPIDRYLLTI
jgi:hypothetical protein